MLARMVNGRLKKGYTWDVLFEGWNGSVTHNLLLYLRFWDDFIVDIDIAIFPCPFSLGDFVSDAFPFIVCSILAHVPTFETPLIL